LHVVGNVHYRHGTFYGVTLAGLGAPVALVTSNRESNHLPGRGDGGFVIEGNGTNADGWSLDRNLNKENYMPAILMWLMGVPLIVIVLLYLIF
jgi:hypothetical protein